MCFSLAWLQQILIFLIIIGAIVAILKLVVPYALSMLGAELGAGANLVIAVFKIVLWAIVAIFCVIICFQLIACLLSYSGGMPSLLPHR